ncbi:AAA-like domain-containing protein [Fimbriimonas ginsengisoli]|uniref:Putative Chase2 sensor protein n=1 Tax=Fimbriimonas ginsengisoli Gsoil 348 TaxID=661478 RepID=A0A068NRI3_FIMGI|nr:AAA-like domain-containing protein [Fimbriimonas ginsengisoli]AIE86036.1 putative Chase2 sensor protein [Fimbriimonas ginsengisoli Gsoil 348]
MSLEPATSTYPGRGFFVSGGTVPSGSPSYVERSADRELYEALLSGEYCYVLNSRQMGKSSLAVRTVARLQERGVRTAFVDLTRIGGANVSAEQWYAGLLAETGRVLDLRAQAVAFLREHKELGPAQRYLSFLQEVALPLQETPLVVLLDEIDAVRSLAFSTDELFAGIRQLHNGRASEASLTRLTFCLLGAALPSDLIRDPRSTPFNVGRRVELRDFTQEEASALTKGLATGGAEQLIRRILHWTGGHPFLTQTLGADLAHKSVDVDQLVRERYLDARARETDTNLADVGNRLLGRGDPNVGDAERADTLSLYAKLLKSGIQDDESNPHAARIKMSGVARLDSGHLTVRNEIYRQIFGPGWIKENMPGQELRRQKRAFWKGALRTTVVAASVVGGFAFLAWSNARLARDAKLAGNREQYEAYLASMQLMPMLWSEGQTERMAHTLQRISLNPARGWEWDFWSRRVTGNGPHTDVTRGSYWPQLSPDGKTILSRTGDRVHLLDGSDLHEMRSFKVPGHDTIAQFAGNDRFVVQERGKPASTQLRDARDGHLVRSLGWNVLSPNGEAISPNGRWMASEGLDGKLSVLDVNTGRIRRLALPAISTGNWWDVEFSQDGRQLVWLCRYPSVHPGDKEPRHVLFIDVKTWKLLHTVDCDYRTNIVRVHPSGRFMIAVLLSGDLVTYDLPSGRKRLRQSGKQGVGTIIKFSPDGRLMSSVANNRILRVDRMDGIRPNSYRIYRGANSCLFFPDSRHLAFSYDRLRLVDLAMPDAEQPFSIGGSAPWETSPIGWSGDRLTAFTGGKIVGAPVLTGFQALPIAPAPGPAKIDSDGALAFCQVGRQEFKILDVASGRELLRAKDESITQTVVKRLDRNRLLIASDLRRLRIWDDRVKAFVKTVRFDLQSSAFALSHDRRSLAVGFIDGTVTVFDTNTWKIQWSSTIHYWSVYQLRFASNDRWLLTAADDDTGSVLEAGTGRTVSRLVGHGQTVASIDLSPDGRRIATGSYDKTVKLWDFATGREITSIGEATSPYIDVHFTLDNRCLVGTTISGEVHIWRR